MTRVSAEAQQQYQRISAAWPAETVRARLDPGEAKAVARELYRVAFGKAFRGQVATTSGVRNTRAELGRTPQRLIVNPQQGWSDIVHLLSHYFHGRLRPGVRPHSAEHAHLEFRLVRAVLDNGWTDGRLRPPPAPAAPKKSIRERRYTKLLGSIERWELSEQEAAAALKRARNRLKTLRRRRRYYERSLPQPQQA